MGFQARLFKLAALGAWATLVAHVRGEDCHSHGAQNEIVAKVDEEPNQKDLVLANPRQDPSGAMEGSRYHRDRRSFLERSNSASTEYRKQQWVYPDMAQSNNRHRLTEEELEDAFQTQDKKPDEQKLTRERGPTWQKPSSSGWNIGWTHGPVDGMFVEPDQTLHLYWRWELRLQIPGVVGKGLGIVAWAIKMPVVVGDSKYYIISRLGYLWRDFHAGRPQHGDWAMYEYHCQYPLFSDKWKTYCGSDYPWYALKLEKNEELNEESTRIDSRGEFKKMSQDDWVA